MKTITQNEIDKLYTTTKAKTVVPSEVRNTLNLGNMNNNLNLGTLTKPIKLIRTVNKPNKNK